MPASQPFIMNRFCSQRPCSISGFSLCRKDSSPSHLQLHVKMAICRSLLYLWRSLSCSFFFRLLGCLLQELTGMKKWKRTPLEFIYHVCVFPLIIYIEYFMKVHYSIQSRDKLLCWFKRSLYAIFCTWRNAHFSCSPKWTERRSILEGSSPKMKFRASCLMCFHA